MNRSSLTSSPLFWLLAVTAVYTAAFMLWYGQTPLGRFPVLDGKENLIMARELALGQHDGEPFFRAPLYPALLSLFLAAGMPETWLPDAARLLNGLLHLASTLVVYLLGLRMCRRTGPSAVAAFLYGLNPVALHFAGDPLDTTLSVTLLLGGVYCLARGCAEPAATGTPSRCQSCLYPALAGLLLGLGVAARPNLLPAACALPLFPLLNHSPKRLLTHARDTLLPSLPPTLSAYAGLIMPLLALGLVNHALSGHFSMLPTQGAYNLWSANKPGAHGRYYEQVLEILSGDDGHRNPSRVESEQLYALAHGEAAADVFVLQRYWRQRAVQAMVDDPAGFIARLGGKAYYLANHDEAYNNKTYGFHKERSPWLRYNPLGWAWLLAAGMAGLLLARRTVSARLLALACISYAAGLLLFYVSARFRLPLAALLAAGSAGLWSAWPGLRQWHRGKLMAGSALILLVLGLSLSRFGDAADPSTRVMDHLLVAQAAFEQGDDALAAREALAALDYRADLRPARELLCLARFNNAVWMHPELLRDRAFLRDTLDLANSISGYSPQIDFVRAVLLWNLDAPAVAVSIWSGLTGQRPATARDALAALVWTGTADASQLQSARARADTDPLLAAALAGADGDPDSALSPFTNHLRTLYSGKPTRE